MGAHSKSTTERGLGWVHQQQVETLKRNHADGTQCWWCDRPMYLDKARNFDERVLEGDHSIPRALGGKIADRLLHGSCNGARGDGSRDDQRPALGGREPVAVGGGDRREWVMLPW